MFNLKNLNNKKLSFIFEILSKINVKLLTTFICLLFIGSSIYGNFEDLASQKIALKGSIWLSWGVGFSFLSIIINAFAWKLLINSIGCNSKKLNIIKIFLSTNIYKYLPGGIWHFVSRYNALRLEFSKRHSIESILLEPLLMLVAGIIFIPFANLNIIIFILCWSTTLILLPGFREFIIKRLMEMKSSIFSKGNNINDINLVQQKYETSSNINYPFIPLFVEIIFILFRFIGFLCCLNAFFIGSNVSQIELISYFSLAWVIGLIIPAAPGGVGVFESVILFCLGSKMPEASLLASLLCYRLVSTLSDIFSAVVYPVKKYIKL